ncbi:bL21 family ribosomal protein, partial [Streptomyces hygroscopicus]
MYAIVRTGGRQQKVAVGDVIEVDRLATSKVGDTVELSTLLVV